MWYEPIVAAANPYAEVTVVPRIAITLPLVLPEPAGFVVERLETWPLVEGRLEYVGGRLEFMPPCGEMQQRVAIDVATELNIWRRAHPEFIVGGNEAGMLSSCPRRAVCSSSPRQATSRRASASQSRRRFRG
jgi:hypothetical protein